MLHACRIEEPVKAKRNRLRRKPVNLLVIMPANLFGIMVEHCREHLLAIRLSGTLKESGLNTRPEVTIALGPSPGKNVIFVSLHPKPLGIERFAEQEIE